MLYEYRCEGCELAYESLTFKRIGDILGPCSDCGASVLRIVSRLNCTQAIEPYFNPSVGQYVTSHKDFEEKLRIGSLEQSERLGIEHRYSVMSPDDSRRQAEATASNDGHSGESLERAHRMYAPPSTTTIL